MWKDAEKVKGEQKAGGNAVETRDPWDIWNTSTSCTDVYGLVLLENSVFNVVAKSSGNGKLRR